MADDVRTFHFSDNDGDYVVTVWTDGRHYDPAREAYHPVYEYKIAGPKWEYAASDIRGGGNETPSVTAAAQSLFAFLYACQEGMAGSGKFAKHNENADLFPPHVREWAYLFAEQIELVYDELVKEVKKQK